jgi:5-methylthioadenosine/S-adenosylhomocysteine deaminase
MAERAPESCDLIIRNACILTMDEKRTIYPSGAIAVRGHTIVAVGPEAKVMAAWRTLRVIDAGGATVHPGFIDAHLHVNAQTCRGFFRGDASKGGGKGPAYADW